MKLQRRQSESPEVNLTSLIDVVLLLIIFFVLASTFDKPAALGIELPQASAKPLKDQTQQPVDLGIDAQGRYYINGRRLVNTQERTVRQALADAAHGRKDPIITLNADARTPHGAVVTAMDAARQLGFVHLRFATRVARGDKGDSSP